jgi:hypothetical protein
MSNKKITELDAITSASTDDILPIVDAPGGSAATKKITFDNLQKSITTIDTTKTGVLKASSGVIAICTNLTDAVPLGAWSTSATSFSGGTGAILEDTVYLALTDGFAVARVQSTSGTANVTITTDSANPPTVTRATGTAVAGAYGGGVCCPVKKGEYVKYVKSGSSNSLLYWIPLGV